MITKQGYRDALGVESFRGEFYTGRHQGCMVAPRAKHRSRLATWGTLAFAVALGTAGMLVPSETIATNQDLRTFTPPSEPSIGIPTEFVVTKDDAVQPASQNISLNSAPRVEVSSPDSSPAKSEVTALFPASLDIESLPLPDILPPSSSESEEIRRLLQLANASLRFDKEPLAVAVAIIADAASMSYTITGELKGVVNGALVGNPYQILQNLSKAYDFQLTFRNGMWLVRPNESSAPKETIEPVETRSYTITNNMLERHSTQMMAGSSSGGGGGTSGGSSGISEGNMLTGRTIFEANYERIHQDLQLLLATARVGQENYKPAVFLNEDGNSLLVVGTAREHELVTSYLDNFDRPQRAIAMEVKLIRTKRNPSSLVGVDWGSGVSVDVSGAFDKGDFKFDQLVGGLGGSPAGVLLTNSQARVTLDAIKNDSLTKRISYIEEMTLDNREVVLSNVIEEPVISDREEVDSESGLRVLLSIEKEIIGTVINIWPRILADNAVKMQLRLEDSNIVRFKQFFEEAGGGEYPVISKQTYEGPVVVKDGYSLAITGFETTEEVLSKNRIPFLGDVPLIGKAFGREKVQEERSYLMVFITPRILPDSTSGIDYVSRGHHLGREEPLGPIEGTQFDNFNDLITYVSGIRRQHDEMMQQVDLKGVTEESIDEALFLHGELESLMAAASEFVTHGVSAKPAASMVAYCQKALSQNWRILQQQRPGLAVSPSDFAQESAVESRSVFNNAREAHKISTSQGSGARWLSNRRRRPGKGH